MEKDKKRQMRKHNMKLFPICKSLGWDYIFFYTTNFLFLTQVKNISPADVVLIESFYALFGIIMQVPGAFIIEYIGRKKSIVFANILNCMYILMIIFSNNLFNLIIAEILSSLAFGIKDSAEPAILNESIPPSRYKSKIFSRISAKGASGYYILNSISKIIAGFFYDINPYIPITLSLTITIIVTLLSVGFIEPQKNTKIKEIKEFNQIKELKDSLKFTLKSERLKSLILFDSVVVGIISVLATYEISLLEELNISAKYLCTIFAILGIVSGILAKKQEKFHNKYKNKSLSILIGVIGLTIIAAGISGLISRQYRIFIAVIIIAYIIKYAYDSIYQQLIEKYLRNFANEKIDTKIFVIKNFLGSIQSAFIGIIASFLLDRMNTAYCMMILGISTLLFTIVMNKYMKTRVGLKPEEYSKDEIKYDELN